MASEILTVDQHRAERVALKESDDYRRRDDAWVRLREHDAALRALVKELADALDDARAQHQHIELLARARLVSP